MLQKNPFFKFCFRDIYSQTASEFQNSCPYPSQYPHNYVGYRQEFPSLSIDMVKTKLQEGSFILQNTLLSVLLLLPYFPE